MKRLLHILTLALTALTLLSGCAASYKDMKVTSFDIEKFNLDSPKTLSVTALVGVNNPAPDITFNHVTAVVKSTGRNIVTLKADGVKIDGKKEAVYSVPVKGSLSDGTSVLKLLGGLKNGAMSDFTADITANVTVYGKIGKTLEYKDVKLDKLMDIL